MHNCALRNKLVNDRLNDSHSDLETWQVNDAVLLDRSSAVDIGYSKIPERFC
jgi:hypothetical protein